MPCFSLREEGRTIFIIVQGTLDHLGGGPLELEGGGDAWLRVQHDGVVRVLPAAAPELVLHHLHSHTKAKKPALQLTARTSQAFHKVLLLRHLHAFLW